MQQTCLECKAPLTHTGKYCSYRCAGIRNARIRRELRGPAPTTPCETCMKSTRNRRFCSHACRATIVNAERLAKNRVTRICACCASPIHSNLYCSNKCQAARQRADRIQAWLSGTLPDAWRYLRTIRTHVLETRGCKCEDCGWNRVHPTTGVIPLHLDHVDGDWKNCDVTNLRIRCLSCHALTETFSSLNQNAARAKRGLKPIETTRRQHVSKTTISS